MIRKISLKMTMGQVMMGTVFLFGEAYWNKEITPDEARHLTAIYESHKVSRSRHSIREIVVRFSDHDDLCIAGCCVDAEMIGELRDIPAGAKAEMLVHPNSDTIIEMSVQGKEIVDFDEAMKDLMKEKTGFGTLGIFMYCCALAGLIGMYLNRGISPGI